jgi:hypothetical protein
MRRKRHIDIVSYTDKRGRQHTRITASGFRRGCLPGCLPGCGAWVVVVALAVLVLAGVA